MIELDSISVSIPDNGIKEEGWQWAKVIVLLRDETTGENSSAEANVHIRYDDSRSISEAKQEARDNTLRVLREAVRFLEEPA